jgi:uncharacterized phage protein (TIGR01671 family)
MREVKFKVWDKKLNVMWQPILLSELLRYLVFQSMPNSDAYCAMKDHLKEMVWLQFTGLKDKRGVEIYEGDILELIRSDGKTIRAVCKWGVFQRAMDTGTLCDIPSFSFVYKDRPTFPIIKNYKGVHDLDIIEVIGNIHENPELLAEGEGK